MSASLRITEIFYSLQGESRTVGLPTVFVRLTGCPLRCVYCDSEYAFQGGKQVALDEIVAQVASYQPRYVCVTGGEPLAQPNCLPLLSRLCDRGYEVSLETSGAMPIEDIDPRVVVVLDLKTPGSGEVDKNRYENIRYLKAGDQLKFVLMDRADYEWAKEIVKQYELLNRCGEILFSPGFDTLALQDLADWILADNLPVRMQLQMHKYIWGDKPGH